MGLIKKFNELSTPKTVKMMVYGVAGSGKTTLALSSPNPLLLDFDRGVHRVNIEHLKEVDTVQVESWNDVMAVLREDLSDYDTIVVDTIGKMMDYIITHICGMRQPQIQDWGKVNAEFQNFTRAISSIGKHVIFVAHRDTRLDGNDTVYIPALREKNYSAIITDIDLLGYVEMITQNGVTKRSVTFNPTPRNDGKNTCNLPATMPIDELMDKSGKPTKDNDWVQRNVIAPYMEMLDVKVSAVNKYNDLLTKIEEDINNIETPSDATAYIEKVGSYEHIGTSLQKARQLFSARVNTLGFTYDKEKGQYFACEPETNNVEQQKRPSLL